jgi:hypothetical protein
MPQNAYGFAAIVAPNVVLPAFSPAPKRGSEQDTPFRLQQHKKVMFVPKVETGGVE